MLNNRKFTVAIILIVSGILYLLFCIKWKQLLSVAVPYYTFLGVVGSGFFAANVGEHIAKVKGGNDASNIPTDSQPA